MVVLAPHGEVAKTLPVVRLATHKLIVSVHAVLWVELLAATLAGKHMATVLLKADPCLEGNVADDKADPSVWLQLNQICVLQYF